MNIKIKKSLLLLYALAIILVIVVGIIVFSLLTNRSENNPPATIPTPTPITTEQNEVRLQDGASEIKTESVFPAPNTPKASLQNPSQKLTFTLNEPISASEVKVQILPNLPINVTQGVAANEIVVFPTPPEFWIPNTQYSITLLDNANRIISQYFINFPRADFPEVND